MPVLRNVVRNAAKNNYSMQSIILGIVQSSPFQMRTKLADATVAAIDNRPAAVNTVAKTEQPRSSR